MSRSIEERQALSRKIPQVLKDFVLNNTSNAMFAAYEDKIVIVNSQCLSMFGCSDPADMIDHVLFDFMTPESALGASERRSQRIAGYPSPEPYIADCIGLDGRAFKAEISVIPWPSEPHVFVAMMHDRTGDDSSIKALRDAEKLYRTIAETLPVGVFLIDESGNQLYINERASKITGYSVEELMRGVWMIHPDDSLAWELCERALQDGTSGYDYETICIRKDGSFLPVSISWHPVIGSNGNIKGLCITLTDISEHKKAEAALHKADERYKLLTENSTDILWEMDLEGRFTYISPAIKRLGYDAEEWIGRTLLDFLPEAEHDVHLSLVKADLDNPAPCLYEVRACRKDGSPVWLELSVDFLKESGIPVRIQGAARDISARKRAEINLQQTTQELEAIVQAFPDLYFLVTADGMIINYHASDIAELYTPPAEFMGKRMQDVLPENVARRYEEWLTKAFETKSQVTFEYSLMMPSGDNRYEARCVPMPEEQILIVVRNITDHYRISKALRESEQKHKSIVENSSDIIVLDNANGDIVYLSPAIKQISGYEPEELLGSNPWFIYPDDLDKVIDLHRKAHSGVSGTNCEYRIITKSGETKWVSHSWSPIFAEDKLEMVVSIVRDVTEKKKAEEELRKAHADLEKAYQLQREFLNNVTHEVRTPLTAVRGYVEMLLEGMAGPVTDSQAELLRKVLSSSGHLLEIVSGVLEIARLQSGAAMLYPKVCNPMHIIEKAVSAVLPQALRKGLKINTELDSPSCLGVYDEDKLVAILTNLLSNAVKFTAEGKIDLIVTYTSSCIEIIVSDTGMGIPARDLGSIFDEFSQLDYPKKHKPTGFGIGLAIVANMVETIGATLVVSSRKDVGTAFTLSVPTLAENPLYMAKPT